MARVNHYLTFPCYNQGMGYAETNAQLYRDGNLFAHTMEFDRLKYSFIGDMLPIHPLKKLLRTMNGEDNAWVMNEWRTVKGSKIFGYVGMATTALKEDHSPNLFTHFNDHGILLNGGHNNLKLIYVSGSDLHSQYHHSKTKPDDIIFEKDLEYMDIHLAQTKHPNVNLSTITDIKNNLNTLHANAMNGLSALWKNPQNKRNKDSNETLIASTIKPITGLYYTNNSEIGALGAITTLGLIKLDYKQHFEEDLPIYHYNYFELLKPNLQQIEVSENFVTTLLDYAIKEHPNKLHTIYSEELLDAALKKVKYIQRGGNQIS